MGGALRVAVPVSVVTLAGFGVAAVAQGVAAGTKANRFGPTVEQMHAAPINFGLASLQPYEGKKPGPITTPGGLIQYEYSFPDGSKVRFGRCGSDHRCDLAVLMTKVGSGGSAAAQAANDAVQGCLINDLGPSEPPIRAINFDDARNDVIVVQRLAFDDASTADVIHRKYYPTLVECARYARYALKAR